MTSTDDHWAQITGEIDRIAEASLDRLAVSLAERGYRPSEIEQVVNVGREIHAAERIKVLAKVVRFAMQPDARSLELQ